MKIPFDIKYRPQIESGEYKVETRDGRPARIICWDKKEYEGQRESPTPIVYLLLSKSGCEHVMDCTLNGLYSDGLERDSDLLIVIPEPELTEFEEHLKCILDAYSMPETDCYAAAKLHSSALLALAKKEVMKDLPKWKKVEGGGVFNNPFPILFADDKRNGVSLLWSTMIDEDGYFIPIKDLKMLPKEE